MVGLCVRFRERDLDRHPFFELGIVLEDSVHPRLVPFFEWRNRHENLLSAKIKNPAQIRKQKPANQPGNAPPISIKTAPHRIN